MPPPTASLRPDTSSKKNAEKSSATAAAAATTASAGQKLSKPDQAAYNKEQDDLNKEIDGYRKELNDIKSRLSLLHSPQGGDGNDRRSQIRAEMDQLQGKQGASKADRGKTLDTIKRHQDTISLKSKEISTIRSKLPFRTSNEIQSRIDHLNKQVESGTLKLIDEKKALNEISALRRSLKSAAQIDTLESDINSEKEKVEALRKVLDDPEVRSTQVRWDELKKELDGMREEGKKAYEERGALFDRRNELQKKMDELYEKKRSSNSKFRADGDAYYAKIAEEKRLKQERFKSERAAEDAARQTETIERMREEAKEPAFGREIEDCGVLIGWFERTYGAGKEQGVLETAAGFVRGAIEGIKSLDIRQVEDQPIGTVLKKDRDDLEGWGAFGGSGKGKKGKKGSSAPAASKSSAVLSTTEPSSTPVQTSNQISLPFSTLNTLLGFGISPPANKDDVPRVIEDLSTKKAWFEANQKRKTEDEVKRVEAVVAKMLKKSGGAGKPEEEEEISKEVGGEKEPVHTAAVTGDATHDIPVDQGEQLPASPEEKKDAVDLVDKELEQAKVEEEA